MENGFSRQWRAGDDTDFSEEKRGPCWPKGYCRSEDRIYEEVCERLTWSPTIDATDVEVQVKGTTVYLGGRVPQRGMKHAAEDCALEVGGVEDVVNDIRVVSECDQHLDNAITTGVY